MAMMPERPKDLMLEIAEVLNLPAEQVLADSLVVTIEDGHMIAEAKILPTQEQRDAILAIVSKGAVYA